MGNMRMVEKRPFGIILLSIYFGWRGIMAILYVFSMIYAPQIIGKMMDLRETWEVAFPYFLPGLDIFFYGVEPFFCLPPLFPFIPIILGFLYLMTMWGLFSLKPWSRTAVIIFATIGLINFVIGTIIGIAILWYMFKPEIKKYFRETKSCPEIFNCLL